jgi:integrase
VRSLKAADVRDLLAILKVERNIGCRNAALLTLGFGAALRRSELVGLDWQELGTETGFVRIDERGILITLARSKASQDKAETVVIPRTDFMAACEALEAWAARVPLQPGEPMFRAVNNRSQISAERLTAHSVSRIVFSGHSLRAGFVTSAAAVDVPPLRIAQHTRYKSLEMVNPYCREADKYNRSRACSRLPRRMSVPDIPRL